MSMLSQVETLLTSVSNLYIGNLPSTPDNAVSIRNSGGYPRSLSGSFVGEPTFQVRVRNTSYATGLALCETIAAALHGKTTAKLLMIEQQSDILDLGRDESSRNEWTINFRCYYRI